MNKYIVNQYRTYEVAVEVNADGRGEAMLFAQAGEGEVLSMDLHSIGKTISTELHPHYHAVVEEGAVLLDPNNAFHREWMEGGVEYSESEVYDVVEVAHVCEECGCHDAVNQAYELDELTMTETPLDVWYCDACVAVMSE